MSVLIPQKWFPPMQNVFVRFKKKQQNSTYPLLEPVPLLHGESVRLGNDWDNVDTMMQALHEFHINWPKAKRKDIMLFYWQELFFKKISLAAYMGYFNWKPWDTSQIECARLGKWSFSTILTWKRRFRTNREATQALNIPIGLLDLLPGIPSGTCRLH